MAYQHKSDAQKRKYKQKHENACVSGRKTLESMGFSVSRHPSQTVANINEQNFEHQVPSTSVVDFDSDSISGSATEFNAGSSNQADSHNASSFGCDNDSDSHTYTSILGYDVGVLQHNQIPSALEIEDAVRRGPLPIPVNLPPDIDGHPKYILNKNLQNGETVTRDWLVWSVAKQTLFCFPCRLFDHNKIKEPGQSVSSQQSISIIATVGWGPSRPYKKLYDRIPHHESSKIHKANYIEWRQLENNLATNRTVGGLLDKEIHNQKQNWKDLLRRFLDVTLFLAERGLAFRGDSLDIGNPKNGNFLGILELISHYNALLAVHLEKVKRSQEKNERLQVHYLSPTIQNEFISCCAEHVRCYILKERAAAKYFSIIVDATPDSSHDEQTSFIIRYVGFANETSHYQIYERFLVFENCNQKTGDAIAQLILNVLNVHTEEYFSKSTTEEIFKCKVFNAFLDNIIVGLTMRFNAVQEISNLFSILGTFTDSSEEVIEEKSSVLQNKYESDIGPQLKDELLHLKVIYNAIFGSEKLEPLELLNKIRSLKLEAIFPNVVVSLRIFCTIPVTVAQAERSFSCLARIKNVLRSTMKQDRLCDLGLLAIETEVARKCNFEEVIEIFASRKARKAPL